MTWRMLDLFSGIGGFSLAAQWVWGDKLEIIAFCEIDKFCQKVLRKHWPDVPIIEDVRDVTKETLADTKSTYGKRIRGTMGEEKENPQKQNDGTISSGSYTVDLLTGGFPCQPFSVAGKRKGKEDNRFLWPEMFTVIKEIRPRWIIAENVAGIVRMALDDCLSDLEGEGYSTQAVIIPACSVNAPQRRDRVWIVANSEQSRLEGSKKKTYEWEKYQPNDRNILGNGFGSGSQDVADSQGKSITRIDNQNISKQKQGEFRGGSSKGRQLNWWSTEPDVGRVAHGVPNRVDRLKSLGNAIVPQIAEVIMRGIKEIEEME